MLSMWSASGLQSRGRPRGRVWVWRYKQKMPSSGMPRKSSRDAKVIVPSLHPPLGLLLLWVSGSGPGESRVWDSDRTGAGP